MIFCTHEISYKNIELEENKYEFENRIEKVKQKLENKDQTNKSTDIKKLEYNINIFRERKKKFQENFRYYQNVVDKLGDLFVAQRDLKRKSHVIHLSETIQCIIIRLFSNYDYLLIQMDEIIKNFEEQLEQ